MSRALHSTIMKNNSTIQEFHSSQFNLLVTGNFADRRNVKNHAHVYHEIVYILNGRCTSHCPAEQRCMTAEPGMAYFIPPHVEHDQQGLCETIFIGFEIDVQNPIIADRMLLLDLRQDVFVRRWMRDLLELWLCGKNETANFMAMTIFSHLSAAVFRQQQLEKYSGADRLSPALSYIDNNYWKNFTVEDVANYVHCSPSTINNWFKNHCGKSLMRYVYDFRLNIARQMLNNDYLSLGEIAERCGFTDTNYFIRAFRKHYNVTPGEMRRQIRSGK